MDPLPKQASLMILDNLEVLSQIAVDQQYSQQKEFWKAYEQPGYKKSLRDAGYHLSYLAESLTANDPALFLDYVAWVKVLFAGLKFPLTVLTTTLDLIKQALPEKLQPEQANLAGSYIDAALTHLLFAPEAVESFLSPKSPQYELATEYFNTLLQGDRHGGSKIILDAVDKGTPVKDIYLHVFQPCQHEIGRLWQMNQVSVAQEHFCTVATQMVMSQLYPHIFATPKNDHRLVATSVGGELHEIGIRMVTDFLEMEGWDTYYLGANTPTESILRAIQDRKADVVAISATITFHVSKVAALIEQIRSSNIEHPVAIMVGGYPFNVSQDLWKRIGADGFARSAQEAVEVADFLIRETH